MGYSNSKSGCQPAKTPNPTATIQQSDHKNQDGGQPSQSNGTAGTVLFSRNKSEFD
jgi:hypothetical protein